MALPHHAARRLAEATLTAHLATEWRMFAVARAAALEAAEAARALVAAIGEPALDWTADDMDLLLDCSRLRVRFDGEGAG